jgi:hypothetical protein
MEQGIEERSGNPMTKYERRQFFDRLVQLRALYRLRGADDSAVELTIEQALAYGQELFAGTASTDVDGDGVPAPRSVRRGA